ncbi:MAG: c-type cytochrome biogenesis protein CcmI [Gammaproteobacteria bacterium]
MSFIVVGIVLTAVAVACVALPLWRARVRSHVSADAANRAIYASRTEELQVDVVAGRLEQADYAASVRDLGKELAATLDTSREEHERAARSRASRVTAGVVAALIIVATGILYWQLGNWRAGVEGVRQASVTRVEDMVAQLAHRLQTTDPDDLQGWEELGHAYMLMRRYPDAANAYARARALSSDTNAGVLADYGEAVALASPKEFMSTAMPAFEKALQLDPHNPQALWYGGLGALESGHNDLAVARWNALLAQKPPVEYQKIIEKAITAAGGKVNVGSGGPDAGAHPIPTS